MSPRLQEDAKLLTIYIGESDKWRGRALYTVILETLKSEGLAGATVIRGVAGFGAHSYIHTASILRLSEDLPLCIQAVDAAEKITRALEVISPMVTEGLITLEDVKVLKYTHRYLNPLPADKFVEEVMTREVVFLSPDLSISDAWKKMLSTLLKAMPVIDQSRKVVGMLTDEDLLERAGLQQRLSIAGRLDSDFLNRELEQLRTSPLTVAEVMTSPAISVKTNDFLGTATNRMVSAGIKRLPVVNENGQLEGMLSRLDILRIVAEKEARKSATPAGAAISLRDVMSPNIPIVKKDDDLRTIVETILGCGLQRVIVIDDKGNAIGLISDSDVVARIQPSHRTKVINALRGADSLPANETTAGELMSPGVLTADPEMRLVDAIKLMSSPKRKWLVVVDDQNRPLGLVDRQILLRAFGGG
jgi:CBS domain-containing protein